MPRCSASIATPGISGIWIPRTDGICDGQNTIQGVRAGEGTEVSLSVPAQLVYQEGLPHSGSRLADAWHSLTKRLGIRTPRETHS